MLINNLKDGCMGSNHHKIDVLGGIFSCFTTISNVYLYIC